MSARAPAIALPFVFLAEQAPVQVPQFGSRTALVILSATAVDQRGRPVSDLRPHEVRILEEGRPQKLEHFAHGRESRARIVLLADASGSMNDSFKTVSSRMAVVQVLAALDPEDEAALAAFDEGYRVVVPFTRDRGRVQRTFDGLSRFGSTALHDALDSAARDLAAAGEGRRAVVVITDGVDTASERTAEQVIDRSKALDVPIYAVSVISRLDDPESPYFTGEERTPSATAGAEVLKRYASLSGGTAFAVSDFAGLQQAARQIVTELKHQYRLGYAPSEGPPRFRRVEVRSTRKGVQVRTRRGYVPTS